MKVKLSDFLGREQNEGKSVGTVLNARGTDPLFYEQFKALKAKFEYKAEAMKLKVVAVTSAIAGEGKTLTCSTLAMDMASSGRKKVLLIDVDMRKSDLAAGLNVPQAPGLREFLMGTVGSKDILRNSFMPGLYIIPAGNRTASPADLLSGEKFRAFLTEIRDHFDLVLLDTPPILPVADTLALREYVDGFVFMYRVGFTPYLMLKNAIEEVGEEKVIGVVLNGVEPQKEKYYQRYYGKYYRKAGEDIKPSTQEEKPA